MKPDYAKTQSGLKLTDLELILALVRGRTLAGAADRLGVDASTVFRAIKRVEKDLGEMLFERGRQGYLPTDMALALAGHAERIEDQLQEARDSVLKTGSAPAGVVRITTTDTILHGLLLPLLGEFSRAYPQVELELVASNLIANLSRRDADVAFRATRKPPGHLVGSRLGTITAALFGATGYLAGRPLPLAPEHADWIALDESLAEHPSVKWRHARFPQLLPKYRCNSVLSVAGAVVAGLGIGVAPVFLMNNRSGVEIIEGPLPELETDLWMLAHPDCRQLQRVRVLFDFFRERVVL
ncbi:MAG: LysR family transcriptional regulator [Pseudomonadota bacterium]